MSLELRIKTIMSAVFGVPETAIPSDASPANLTTWDSLRHMNLMLALEEEFGVRFPEDGLFELQSLPAIERTLSELLKGTNSS